MNYKTKVYKMQNWNQIIEKLDYAFQPIIYSHTGKIYAVEALIRNVQNIPGLSVLMIYLI